MARAQAAPTPEEQVVVTGSRAVIKSAQAIKRDATAIVDSITATEIERLPDQSLAETLDRVVGVSSDVGYSSSQARTVTIRGFDARYNSMEVDGNPIWNASRNNRGTQLDIFPSTVVSQVNVFKVVDPSEDANSIGGHIELRTLRAFDGGDRPYLRMRAEVGAYDQDKLVGSGGPSYVMSAVGKQTFGPDHRFGFVVGADLQRSRFYDRYNTTTGYSQLNGVDVVNASLFNGRYDERVNRVALYGKLEAHATDKLYAFLFLSYFRERNDENIYRTGPFLTASKVSGAVEGAGAFTNVPDESYLETYNLDRKTTLVGSGLDYRIGSDSVAMLRAAYTRYNHHELDETGERFEGPVVSGSYALTSDSPTVTLSPNALTGVAANWVYRNKNASQLKFLPDLDNVYSVSGSFAYKDFPTARGFGYKLGAGWRRLDRTFDQSAYNYTLPAGKTLNLSSLLAPGAQIDGVSAVVFDPKAFWTSIETNGVYTLDPSQTADYHLIEDVYSAYGSMLFTAEQLRVSIGARTEMTRSTDATADTVAGVITPVKRKIDYDTPLPNAQLTYLVSPKLKLRGAYSETIARPDFSDFAMGRTQSTDANGYPVISGTNPSLKPRTSYNYDLSAEYYDHDAYASLGVFSKKLRHEEFKELIQTKNAAGTVILTVTEPLNSGSGYLEGAEASFGVDRFGFLPKPLDGLYVSGNYTRLHGVWDVVFTDGSSRSVGGLRNQPRWLGNLTGGYRLGPVDVSVAARFRGRTFTGTFGTTAPGDVWYEDYTRVDLHASYRVFRGLEVFVDGRNLNDESLVQTTGISRTLSSAVNPGRSLFIGFKFKP